MADSTRKRLAKKPAKPYSGFPLFAHGNGQWAKKVKGKHVFFGVWADPDAAVAKWLDQRDDLLAGRKPRTNGDGLTVRDLVNRFLTAKRILADSGEIRPRTWRDYHAACERVINTLGGNRPVTDLANDDFQELRAEIAKTWGPVALKTEIQRIKGLFKYGYDAGLIDRPVRFGPMFRPPANRVIQKNRASKGPRMFEASDIRKMLEAARPQPKAMILLGTNCGFGNNDCSLLPQSALDLDGGWVDFPRPKNGTPRRCPLWPETVEALKAAIAARPAPKNPADDNLVFLTRPGNRWVRLSGDNWLDGIGMMFWRLLTDLGLKRPGLSFYCLRHTFETVAGESLDQVGVNSIMGHADGTMAGVYRERVTDARLRAVTDHVRQWLFGDTETK